MSKYWLVFYNGFNLNLISEEDEDKNNIYLSELVYCESKEGAIKYIANKLDVTEKLFDAREMVLHDLSKNDMPPIGLEKNIARAVGKKYYKITNAAENHYGFQYKDGLNILEEKFNDDPEAHCCAGGLYFTDAKNIFEFLNYGIYLREITLPVENPDFEMVVDENKYRANMIILGKRYELANVETIKMLIEAGANRDCALRYIAEKGHLEVVKYLIEKGADVHTKNDSALRTSAEKGHLEVVKYLIEKGADIHAVNDSALHFSVLYGHLEVVKYLIEAGADVHANHDLALRWSANSEHLEIVKYLIEKGANIDLIKDHPIMEKLKINN